MKRLLLNLLKFGVSFAIVGWLVSDVARNDPHTFERLVSEPKQWPLLLLAGGCLLGALMVGWTRWCLIARLLGLRVRLADAYRLGFLGYMLDFLALGTAGGDAAKAIMLGREQGGHWSEPVASVILDRLIGLFSLAIVASIALATTDIGAMAPQLRAVARLTQIGAAAAACGFVALFIPGLNRLLLEDIPRLMPWVGKRVGRMTDAVRSYERRRAALPALVGMSLFVPCLNVLAFFLIASALPLDAPSLHEHFVIIPPAMISGAVPLPMEALGVFEYAMSYLYEHVGEGSSAGRGLLVALTYRLLTICIILVGTPLFLRAGGGAEVREAVEATRAAQPEGSSR